MATADDPLRIVWTTLPPQDAARIVTALVDARLVACGNIIPGVRSIYRWQGEVCDDDEAVVIMETTASSLDAAMERLAALHPYDVPKIIALNPVAVAPAYLAWARDVTGC